jgi:hypothetical protein
MPSIGTGERHLAVRGGSGDEPTYSGPSEIHENRGDAETPTDENLRRYPTVRLARWFGFCVP